MHKKREAVLCEMKRDKVLLITVPSNVAAWAVGSVLVAPVTSLVTPLSDTSVSLVAGFRGSNQV